MSDVELALDSRSFLAEGPSWDARTQTLLWTDIPACRFHRFDPATGRNVAYATGGRVGAVVPREHGGVLLASEDAFLISDDADTYFDTAARIAPEDANIRFNDGKCDPAGRMWAGTLGLAGRCALYRFTSGAKPTTQVTGVGLSNGLGWSPDEETMYYIDTPTGGVDAFDFSSESGEIRNRRRLADVPDGRPDGLCVDGDGGIWVAIAFGWAVRRYTPDGRLDRVIRLPTAQVTSCAFGGRDLRTLFITTGMKGLTGEQRDEQRLAGGIFACTPGVTGLNTTPFKG
ncbi:MAG: SMP-30/gluconolactonase/LRE family protein [Stackebrandtia sp.]